jgi:hypothetical protein
MTDKQYYKICRLGEELENVGQLIGLIKTVKPVIKNSKDEYVPLNYYVKVPHNVKEQYQDILNKAAEDIRLLLVNEQTRLQIEFDNIELKYKT